MTYVEYQLPRWWVPWEWAGWVRMKYRQREYRRQMATAKARLLLSHYVSPEDAARAVRIEAAMLEIREYLDRPRA